MNDARSRLIVALDVPDGRAGLAAVERLKGHVGCFKIGLEIFVSEGPRLVQQVKEMGERVFLDLKLHDIPNTVGAAVRSAVKMGVDMLTVHASGGSKMLEAAREAAEIASTPPLLLAVTALTSLSEPDIRDLGMEGSLDDWAHRMACSAAKSGIPGLVTSAWELERLRNAFPNMRFVVPGIRPEGSQANDQSRTATPSAAIRKGADFLVVGRPILRAPDPEAAADQIVAEIAQALRSSKVT